MKVEWQGEGRISRAKWWNPAGFVLFVVLVSAILSCLTSSVEAQVLVHDRTEFILVTDSTLSMLIPDYLVQVDDLSPDAILQFKNIYSETYLMVIPEEKSSNGHLGLRQLDDHFKTNLLLRGALLLSSQAPQIGLWCTIQHEVEWEVEDESLIYLVTFIETPTILYKIYGWTLRSQREYLADFRKATNSFSLQSPIHTSR